MCLATRGDPASGLWPLVAGVWPRLGLICSPWWEMCPPDGV